jgi:hypothetical protein
VKVMTRQSGGGKKRDCVAVRHGCDQGADEPVRQQQTRGSAEDAQNETLGQELPDQPSASSANGLANGDLPLARYSPRQQKTGKVRASKQKDEGDNPHQYEQRFGIMITKRIEAVPSAQGGGPLLEETGAVFFG